DGGHHSSELVADGGRCLGRDDVDGLTQRVAGLERIAEERQGVAQLGVELALAPSLAAVEIDQRAHEAGQAKEEERGSEAESPEAEHGQAGAEHRLEEEELGAGEL